MKVLSILYYEKKTQIKLESLESKAPKAISKLSEYKILRTYTKYYSTFEIGEPHRQNQNPVWS
ncbi:MAG: hypothetical protein O4749_06590, partial [Trichodesmium sp. St5_bin2_1]|nr:hypothetical protein [Trichodesmium sp. St5_bin2_1]